MIAVQRMIVKLHELLQQRECALMAKPAQLVVHPLMWHAMDQFFGRFISPDPAETRNKLFGIPVKLDDSIKLYSVLVIDHLYVQETVSRNEDVLHGRGPRLLPYQTPFRCTICKQKVVISPWPPIVRHITDGWLIDEYSEDHEQDKAHRPIALLATWFPPGVEIPR